MISRQEQLERFSAQIDKAANKQVKKHETAAKKLLESETAALEQELAQKTESRIKFESGRINASANSRLTELENSLTLAVSERRNEICTEVFAAVEKRVAEFAQSDEYSDFLAQSAASLASYLGECTLLCRAEDAELVRSITATDNRVKSVEADESNTLGGLKGIGSGGNVTVYDTLQSRIERSRENFLASADLTI